ncbi:glutaredoxin family protein [Georgenia sp. MJ173]|uniref:glutaredoxin family protein n=1 Tax=Georgenia sunbinii TaxID=3117728 RepID=UPI002F25EF3A
MYTVTVYTTPNCIRCDITRRVLDKAGISYRTVDVADDPAVREYVTAELGYTEAPVVVVDQDADHHWSGFRPDKIKALATIKATISGNRGDSC